jgi:Flp pilus assembly protein TadG
MRHHPSRREAATPPDRRGETGAVTTSFLLTMVPVFVILLGIVFDFAQGFTANARALNVADQAARAGAQQIDLGAVRDGGVYRLDEDAARNAARNFLDAAGYPSNGTITISGTPPRESVNVTTEWSSEPAFLGIINIPPFGGEASGSARMAVGTDTEVP